MRKIRLPHGRIDPARRAERKSSLGGIVLRKDRWREPMEFEILDHETLPNHGEHAAFSQLERQRTIAQRTREAKPSRKMGVQYVEEHPVAPS